MPVAQLCREHGMMPLPGNGLQANHERERIILQVAGEIWRDALSGFCFAKPCRVTDASMIAHTKAVEEESRRLKKMAGRIGRWSRLCQSSPRCGVCWAFGQATFWAAMPP
jgi:hypothetical protein